MYARVVQCRIARSRGRRRFSADSAFTLIEVLVVVAIIGLLAAILIPSLARSRESARAVVCKTNLKEWGNAMLMYVNDNRGTLPFEDRPNPENDVNGDKVWDETGWVCWFDSMDRYFGSKKADEKVKICPTVTWNHPNREESYKMNSKLAETNIAGDPDKQKYERAYRKLGTLHRPSSTVILFDGDVGGGTPTAPTLSFKGRWRASKGRDDVNYRHLKSTNILFADWHVMHYRDKALADQSVRNTPIIWQPADMGPWDPDPPANQ